MSDRFPELRDKLMGKQVTFLGATKEQIQWGSNDDPNKVLTVGEVYDVETVDVHSWHTKITLIGFDGIFNSSSFELLTGEPQ